MIRATLAAFLAVFTMATPGTALAADEQTEASENPYQAADASWISLSGTVTEADRFGFRLDYGPDVIRVEMDDWDAYPEGHKIFQGDRVHVQGRVDADLFQARTIEARSVYVDRLKTYFYASDDDEEAASYMASQIYQVRPSDSPYIKVSGRITAIDGREFDMQTGSRTLRVDTDTMSYDPMAAEGSLRIAVGDMVSVFGRIDVDLFEKREVDAYNIVRLQKSQKESSS